MKIRFILSGIIVVSTVLLIFFQEETMDFIGGEEVKIENPFQSSAFTTEIKFSVIRFDGKVVSAVPIVSSEKITHFYNADKEFLKSTMGIEAYFENQDIIKSYKKLTSPYFVPSKGPFKHQFETITVEIN